MKKITLFLIIAVVAFACNKEKSVTISGKISNHLSETATIHINYIDKYDTVRINPDGTFLTTLIIEKERMAYFRGKNFSMYLYLVPDATINLEFDNNKKLNSENLRITGAGSGQTALLFSSKNRIEQKNNNSFIKLPVDSFATEMNNLMEMSNAEIEKFQSDYSPSTKFIENIKLTQKVGFAKIYKRFINNHSYYAPNDTTAIPDSFQAFIDEIPIDDFESCKEIPSYKYYVYRYYKNLIEKKIESDTTIKKWTVAYYNKNADEIANLEVSSIIKNLLGSRFVVGYFIVPDSIQRVMRTRYKDVLQKKSDIDNFEKTVKNIEKLKPGVVAPSFKYPDINGNMISSESLKGKVIYVDVWATGCGPCIGEIPYLEKLEDELQDKEIAFVSISVDEDEKAWKKMVIEKELGGYQLYAKEAFKSDITKDYEIKGIPYFILIDKEGKLVDVNATRPSNEKTKEQLLELAKQ